MTNRPNILFLMTDQQQASTIWPDSPCWTPNLDAMADEGILFRRAYTCNAICSPTRASLMSGVLPHTHGMHDCTHVVSELHAKYDDTLPTWPQHLVDAGYQTAYYGKWHVERSGELDRFGWQTYDECGGSYRQYREAQGLPPSAPYTTSKSIGGNGYRDTVLYGVTEESPEDSRPAYIYGQAMNWLENGAREGEPWCLFVSTPEPHDIYLAHKAFRYRYDPADLEPPSNWRDPMADKPAVLRRMQAVFAELTWDDVAEATACYYASCSLIDAQVGRLVELLKARGEWENTIVVYTADHGDMMGAHGLFTKGITHFEEVYRVPFILRVPENDQAGAVTDRVIASCDIGPTLLDLAGVQPFPETHFRSLAPLLEDRGDEEWDDVAFAEFYGQRWAYTQKILWWENWKYVFNAFDDDELYDLDADPGESQNLAALPRYREVKERMLRRVWRTTKETGDTCSSNAHYWSLRFFDLGPDSAA